MHTFKHLYENVFTISLVFPEDDGVEETETEAETEALFM